MHSGLALELARALEEARRGDAATARRSRDHAEGTRMRRADGAFDHILSIAGAAMLLAVVLLGPVGTVSVAVAALAIASAIAAAPRRAAPGGAEQAGGAPASPEASDPWLVWRAVEPDEEFLRRPAA